ncbi:MAG: DUF4430 domain-containing protein [Oscillospiraceae bacterium]|nr:DUF4430 domain-containing protein [Oscillospiraceae bacterium]
MRKSNLKKWLSLVLCLALLAAAALCNMSLAEPAVTESEETVIMMNGTREEPVVMGTGKTSFLLQVVDPEEKEAWFEIHTDAENVGDALLENGLVAGDNSDEYGLFVNAVCGIVLTWSEDTPYFWGFYVNDESSDLGVSSVTVEEGNIYAFKSETFTY